VSGSKTSYWPFGAVRSGGSALGDKLYTGQQKESDDGLGLYDYGARFYSTVLGRFAAVDPIIGSAGDPQSWNAYGYVRNNPLSYTDPTGRCVPGVSCPGDASQNQREHDDLVGALLYLAANHAAQQAWADSNTISNGGAGDCDTACQWMAAARGYEEAALAQQRHDDLVAALIYLAATQPDPGALLAGDVGVRPAPYGVPLPPLPHRLSPEEVRTIEDFASNVAGTFADAGRWWHNLSQDTDGSEPPAETVAPVPDDPEIAREAQRIAHGHAGTKHADEFPDAQGSDELAGRVAEIMRNPTAVKQGARGRTAYWDEASATIVITDPNNPDGGSVFRPTNGREYFDDEFN
jgi:RHS repeat-associated protein